MAQTGCCSIHQNASSKCSQRQWQSILRWFVINRTEKIAHFDDYFLGLKLHLIDIYLEELAKVAGTALKPKRLILLLSPFFNIIKTSDK